MKISFIKSTLFSIIFLGFIISCSKDEGTSTPPITRTIEYKIDPADNYIISITFNDQAGQFVTLNDINQMPGGIKSISVSNFPFTAKLEAQVYNTTTATLNYSLIISVDNQVKKFYQLQVPPAANTTGQVEFVVQ
jgi:hypothetical protein